MRKFWIVFFIGLMLSPIYLWANTDLRVAAVDFRRAVNEVEQGKAAKKRLEADFNKKKKKIEIQQKELEALQANLQEESMVLPPDKLRAKQAEFQEKILQLRQKMGEYQQEIVEQEAQLSGKIIENLRLIVESLGKEKGYTLIVEKSNDPILFVKTKDDLTNEVIKRYNKQYK
jgi:outer membrane protein